PELVPVRPFQLFPQAPELGDGRIDLPGQVIRRHGLGAFQGLQLTGQLVPLPSQVGDLFAEQVKVVPGPEQVAGTLLDFPVEAADPVAQPVCLLGRPTVLGLNLAAQGLPELFELPGLKVNLLNLANQDGQQLVLPDRMKAALTGVREAATTVTPVSVPHAIA